MKFQDVVEKLVSDQRAESIGRTSWAMHSIIFDSESFTTQDQLLNTVQLLMIF